MGLMKRFLDDMVCELADKIGVTPATIYMNRRLYDIALRYTDLRLLGNMLSIIEATCLGGDGNGRD